MSPSQSPTFLEPNVDIIIAVSIQEGEINGTFVENVVNNRLRNDYLQDSDYKLETDIISSVSVEVNVFIYDGYQDLDVDDIKAVGQLQRISCAKMRSESIQ